MLEYWCVVAHRTVGALSLLKRFFLLCIGHMINLGQFARSVILILRCVLSSSFSELLLGVFVQFCNRNPNICYEIIPLYRKPSCLLTFQHVISHQLEESWLELDLGKLWCLCSESCLRSLCKVHIFSGFKPFEGLFACCKVLSMHNF